jgi:hypothetical protein
MQGGGISLKFSESDLESGRPVLVQKYFMRFKEIVEYCCMK